MESEAMQHYGGNCDLRLLCNVRVVARMMIRASVMICLTAVPFSGCGDEDTRSADTRDEDTARAKPVDVLIFPDELHVRDASVNAFVERAMHVCGAGEYEAFRALWSVREDPLPRDEFEQGWQAVELARIRALQPVVIASESKVEGSSGEKVYLVLAEVRLDPGSRAGEREPRREVVLMLVREGDRWRLAKTPKKLRAWIKKRVNAAPPPGGNKEEPAPGGDSSHPGG